MSTPRAAPVRLPCAALPMLVLLAAASPLAARAPDPAQEPGVVVAGRIVDLSGRPIERAEIRLGDALIQEDRESQGGESGDGADGSWEAPAFTTARGSFRIPDVAPGPVMVRVEAEGHVSDVRELEIPRGGLLGLEIALEPGRTLAGIVFDPDGFPLPEVNVRVADERVRPVASDSSGRFRLEGVPSTLRYLHLRARGRVGHREAIGGPAREESEAVGEDLRITLSRGLDLSGHLSGLDDAERRLALVRATRLHRGRLEMAESRLDGENGRFTLWGLSEGEWLVVAEVSERRRARRIVLDRGQPSPSLELSFAAGDAVSGRITLLGRPLEDLELTLLAAGAESWITARTDSRGRFRLEGLPSAGTAGPEATPGNPGPGALLRIFSRQHRFSHALVLDLRSLTRADDDSEAGRQQDGAGGDWTLDLDLRPRELEGRVVDGAGSSVAAVRLRLTPEGEAGDVEHSWAESDADGHFRIFALFLGPALLTADPPRAEPTTLRLELREGHLEPVTVRLATPPP